MNTYWLKKLRKEANEKIQANLSDDKVVIAKKDNKNSDSYLTCFTNYSDHKEYRWNGGYSYRLVEIKANDIKTIKKYLAIGRRLYILNRLKPLQETRKKQHLQEILNNIN